MGVDVTELVVLDPDRLDGVGTPANGATSFLLIKAAADGKEKCGTCDGSGKIMGGNRECPDCKGEGEVTKSDSAEADAEEDEVTGSSAKEAEAVDKALSAADRKAMPASSFAFVDKNGGKHLPIHDEAHAKAALGRFGQQDFSAAKGDAADAKQKAASKIKSAAKEHGIEVDDKSDVAEAASKNAAQDALGGLDEPKQVGHLDTGHSGLVGPVVTGVKPAPDDSALVQGGETTALIPDELKVTDHAPVSQTTDGWGIVNPQAIAKAIAAASLVEAMDGLDAQRQAIKDGTFPEPTPEESATPGNMPWESYDAATLRQVGETLAGCCTALDSITERERTESRVADAGDTSNAWDLEDAQTALEFALGTVARLSYHEAAEGEATKGTDEEAVKVGRMLSGKNMSALEAAHKHLGAVIDGAKGKDDDNEETIDMASVTKDELTDMVSSSAAASAVEAVKEYMKAEKEAAAEEAEKNANNGGDISTADIKPTASADADDVNAIPDGGKVDAQYVNKGADEALTKQVSDQLEDLKKDLDTRLGSVEEMVAKFAKRPRAGGPSLDGQARGAFPGAEGRLSDTASKSTQDAEIETLEKSLAEETNPSRRAELGEKLTYARIYASVGGQQA
jgi:hypothetical protein